MQTVFFVRCQGFDDMARNVATKLTDAGAKVVIIPDERKVVTSTENFDKISMTEAELDSLGLIGLPENWGWLCGDVWHYVARKHMPEVTHYCLVESDVDFTGAAAERFFHAMQNDPPDVLCAHLSEHKVGPGLSQGLSILGFENHWGCLFSVTRCSGAAIDWMLDLRRRSVTANVAGQVNDEAVLAAAAQSGAFTFQSLNDLLPDLFQRESFTNNPPFLAEAVQRNQDGDAVLHPVIPLDVILKRVASGEKNYSMHRLRRVLRMADENEKSQILAAVDSVAPAVPLAEYVTQDRFVFLAQALGMSEPIKVLDIGANPLVEGNAPYVPLLRAGLAEVYGFEPQQEALAALNANKSSQETYFPDAVGDGKNGKLNIYRSQGFTSLYEVDPDSARYLGFGKGTDQTDIVELVTRRLDDLDQVPKVDVLKIDVQGAETQIIRSGAGKLANALVVITEVRMFPIYKAEPRYGDLESALTEQGFEFLRFASLKHVPLTRKHRRSLRRTEFAQAVDGDAIFVRDMRNLEQFSDDVLKKLAVIADSIIDNADLTTCVLEVLESRGVTPETLIPDYIARLPSSKRR